MSSSLGYAERLSWRDDLGGQLGDPEHFDSGPVDRDPKVLELIRLIREAKARLPPAPALACAETRPASG